MNEQLFNILVSAATAAVTGWIAYRFWILQQIREIERDYDSQLRASRMPAYQQLWKEFELLAVYAPAQPVTYEAVRKLGVTLRTWYFNTGGLLFTNRARDAYFLVQDAIDGIAQVAPGDADLRRVSRHWTRSTLTAARTAIGDARPTLRLPDLPSPLASDRVHRDWHDEVQKIIPAWPFGNEPDNDFVLIQFLASSLRTLLAEDLRAREPSMVRPRG